MKRISTILLALAISFPLLAQGADSLNLDARFKTISSEIQELRLANEALLKENQSLRKRLHSTEKNIKNIESRLSQIDTNTLILEEGIKHNADSLQAKANKLEGSIMDTNTNLGKQDKKVRTSLICVSSFIVIILLLIVFSYIIGRKKISKLSSDILNSLSKEMSDIQKLTKAIADLKSAGGTIGDEQNLVKTIADRITFMEMTLYRMDKQVRGYKQLFKSIIQMKDNFAASGYEIVDMLGKEYNDGMKAVASFEDDDTLPQGTRTITKIIKPQINYNGEMIQNAQIVVSQNI